MLVERPRIPLTIGPDLDPDPEPDPDPDRTFLPLASTACLTVSASRLSVAVDTITSGSSSWFSCTQRQVKCGVQAPAVRVDLRAISAWRA